MTKLAFVIPTWNRPKPLERCVESIASQIEPGMDAKIIVLDDGSDDPGVDAVMDRMQVKYDAIEYRKRDEHGDYARSFRYAFQAAPEAEWVWTFGDDDQLRDNALAFMLNEILPGMQEVQFFHIAEKGRESGANVKIVADTLYDLCCTFGWIDMTGFLTGNVTRGHWLAKAAETRYWNSYAKSAFVQSCAILEALKDQPAAFLDIPLVRTQDRSEEQKQAGVAQWIAGNTGERYVYVIDAIELMFENGILTKKLPAKFFRYINYHLWDRFIVDYTQCYAGSKALWPDDVWGRVSRFARFLADENLALQIMKDAEETRALATLSLYLQKNQELLHNQLVDLATKHSAAIYPYQFMEQAERVEKYTKDDVAKHGPCFGCELCEWVDVNHPDWRSAQASPQAADAAPSTPGTAPTPALSSEAP